MSDVSKLAALGTPGYTGRYEIGPDGFLYAMEPDGTWVRTPWHYDDFPRKAASDD